MHCLSMGMYIGVCDESEIVSMGLRKRIVLCCLLCARGGQEKSSESASSAAALCALIFVFSYMFVNVRSREVCWIHYVIVGCSI